MNPIDDFWGSIWIATKFVVFTIYLATIVFGPAMLFATIVCKRMEKDGGA